MFEMLRLQRRESRCFLKFVVPAPSAPITLGHLRPSEDSKLPWFLFLSPDKLESYPVLNQLSWYLLGQQHLWWQLFAHLLLLLSYNIQRVSISWRSTKHYELFTSFRRNCKGQQSNNPGNFQVQLSQHKAIKWWDNEIFKNHTTPMKICTFHYKYSYETEIKQTFLHLDIKFASYFEDRFTIGKSNGHMTSQAISPFCRLRDEISNF